MFWLHLAAEIEAFQMHLVNTTHGEGVVAAGTTEFWNVVLTMVRVIWRDLGKVRVEAETAYG